MNEIDDLKKLARDYVGSPEGTLRVATTHTQARYVLPEVVQRFAQRFPRGSAQAAAGQSAADRRDGRLGAGRRGHGHRNPGRCARARFHPGLPMGARRRGARPAIRWLGWRRTRRSSTLKELGRHPIVTYEAHFSGRSRIDAAFADAQIEPSIVLEAIDADVIKTYAKAGLGVGIVAGVATEHNSDGLVVIRCGHLFGRNTTRLAVKQGAYLRGFVYSFIEMVAPGWDRRRFEEEFSGRPAVGRARK